MSTETPRELELKRIRELLIKALMRATSDSREDIEDAPLTRAIAAADRFTAAQSTIAEQAKEIERLRAALGLVCDLASQEWQEEDGSRKAATDNSGARLWFVSADVMQAARRALGEEG